MHGRGPGSVPAFYPRFIILKRKTKKIGVLPVFFVFFMLYYLINKEKRDSYASGIRKTPGLSGQYPAEDRLCAKGGADSRLRSGRLCRRDRNSPNHTIRRNTGLSRVYRTGTQGTIRPWICKGRACYHYAGQSSLL